MSRPLTPAVAVDIIIEMVDHPSRPIVLIERRYDPFGWAIPGGFVDMGERLEQAAIREAKEETSLDVRLLILLGNYSDPHRDPRGHTVSPVYVAEARGEPRAMDDACNLSLFTPDKLPKLVFDHALILEDYRRYRAQGVLTPLRLG
ncbi:MAG: NUDIX hydrolase [Gammaproteobacteria bacterium]|nr:NUDIX hydrolase [Gammaproteobacteria bacterium]